MILDENVCYDINNLTINETRELKQHLIKLEGDRWGNGVYNKYIYYEDNLWWQDSRPKPQTTVVDARTLFSPTQNKVFFNKPKGVVYLEDVNADFTKYNVGIKFKNGVKAILVAKNKGEFFLVDDNIIIDSLDVYDDIFNVVSEQDEVFVFGTFIELLEWKAK